MKYDGDAVGVIKMRGILIYRSSSRFRGDKDKDRFRLMDESTTVRADIKVSHTQEER